VVGAQTGGLRCQAGRYLYESKFKDQWRTRQLFCGVVGEEQTPSISYKRLLALICKMNSNSVAADKLAIELAKEMRENSGTTKKYLSLI